MFSLLFFYRFKKHNCSINVSWSDINCFFKLSVGSLRAKWLQRASLFPPELPHYAPPTSFLASLPSLPPVDQPSKFVAVCPHSVSLIHHVCLGSTNQTGALSEHAGRSLLPMFTQDSSAKQKMQRERAPPDEDPHREWSASCMQAKVHPGYSHGPKIFLRVRLESLCCPRGVCCPSQP